MARIIDGVAIAQIIKNELKQEIIDWKNLDHRAPTIHSIIVGENDGINSYWNQIIEAANYVGIKAEVKRFTSEITERELIENIKALNNDDNIDGVLLFLPLPEGISKRNVCNAIATSKDLDGLNLENVGKLCLDMVSTVPATVLAVIEILKRNNIETSGRNVVIVNRSKHIGMPLAMVLHAEHRHESGLGMDATVTVCHRFTPPRTLEFICQNSDIIITATGVTNIIKKDMVKPGATVIDIGFKGDVDFHGVSKVAGLLTPTHGGVGPVTVAKLMQNALQLAKKLP